MDSKQFDDLIARLASATSRRTAVKGAVGGALASVAGVATVTSAKNSGKKNKKPKKPKKAKKCKRKPKVCFNHNGQIIQVSACAAKAHQNHGDGPPVPCPYG